FFLCLAPCGGRRLFRDMSLLLDPDEVSDLENEPARRRRVDHLDRVPNPPQPEPTQRLGLGLREPDRALQLSHLQLLHKHSIPDQVRSSKPETSSSSKSEVG